MVSEHSSREQAKALGLKRYFTGKPCKYGHVADRYVCSSTCSECCCARNREVARKLRAADPQKVREYQQKYQRARRAANLEKVREREREAARKRRATDPEGYREYCRKWRAANRQKVREYERENKDRIRSQQAERRARDKDKIFAASGARQSPMRPA
jgi:hypothetical protein